LITGGNKEFPTFSSVSLESVGISPAYTSNVDDQETFDYSCRLAFPIAY
jgi:hypothetical protein